jgi:hypothetical protein
VLIMDSAARGRTERIAKELGYKVCQTRNTLFR